MLTAFVLVCALNAPCDYLNASAVWQVPPKDAQDGFPNVAVGNPAMCSLSAQEWAATHIKIGEGYTMKTFCVPPGKLPGNVG